MTIPATWRVEKLHDARAMLPIGEYPPWASDAEAILDDTAALPLSRITDLQGVNDYLQEQPLFQVRQLPPRNHETFVPAALLTDATQGNMNLYSRHSPVSADGRFLLAKRPGGYAIWGMRNGEYIRTVADTEWNGLADPLEPRWIPGTAGVLGYHGYWDGRFYVQQGAHSAIEGWKNRVTLPGQFDGLIAAGNEGAWDNAGRYWFGKFAGYHAVIDIQRAEALPGRIPGAFQGCDMMPDGTHAVTLDHIAGPGGFGMAFYNVEALRLGKVEPIQIDAANVAGGRRIGHTGWGRLKDGAYVLVYRDDKDDYVKYFDVRTGQSTKVYYMPHLIGPQPIWLTRPDGTRSDQRWNYSDHFGRMGAARGWILLSIITGGAQYDELHPMTDRLVMLELVPEAEGPRLWHLCHSRNRFISYFSETLAAMSMNDRQVVWAANNHAQRGLEVLALDLPEQWDMILNGEVAPEPPPVDPRQTITISGVTVHPGFKVTVTPQ
jgi:hypothetical protein